MSGKQSDCDDEGESFNHGAATHPCEYRDGKPCESCNELTEIEAQIEVLRVRHCQARVKRNHVHSPLIHQSPPEIVAYIFTLAIPPLDPLLSWAGKQASPLILTKVCHTWRVLALSTPTLWRDISVDAENPNFPLLNHQVAHSGTVPLSIHLFAFSDNLPMRYAKEAVSFVIKQLPRTASFWLTVPEELIREFDSVSVLDYPKALPLLEELHVLCTNSRSFRLRLAIEPPCPQRLLLGCHSFDQVCLDWTNISTVDCFRVDGLLPLLHATKGLKHLVLQPWHENPPADQTLVVNRTLQDLTLRGCNSAQFMLTMTSLPSLRSLKIDNLIKADVIGPIICDFLHRSLCPLQVLSISNKADYARDGEVAIQALINVLEHANVLEHLTFRLSFLLYEKFPPSILEPLLRRLLQDRGFQPCLQTLSLRTPFVPPIGLLLDLIAADDHPSEIITVRPLRKLILELALPLEMVGTIPRDDLQRILQLRAAGKTISITGGWSPSDLVEYWKSKY